MIARLNIVMEIMDESENITEMNVSQSIHSIWVSKLMLGLIIKLVLDK